VIAASEPVRPDAHRRALGSKNASRFDLTWPGISLAPMSTFNVFLRGRDLAAVVTGEKVELREGRLVFMAGSDVVAEFPFQEVQGWVKVESATTR
jgi:hypothetical protein